MTSPSSATGAPSAQPELLLLGSLPSWDTEPLAQQFRLHSLWDAPDRAAVLAECGAVRAVVTRGEIGADAALMAALPALEIIACFGVGVDAIDLEAARTRGIRVTNTPDVLTGDVADTAIALSLAAAGRAAACPSPGASMDARSVSWASGVLVPRSRSGPRPSIAPSAISTAARFPMRPIRPSRPSVPSPNGATC
jgi:D-3-phosphoglycerate dehydrogenase